MDLIWVNQETFYLLERLIQFYLYDLSKISMIVFSKDAQYDYEGLDLYIKDKDLSACLMKVDQHVIGFALLNRGKYVPQGYDYAIHGLYVYPLYRKKYYAYQTIVNILQTYPGHYFIPVLASNKDALSFWHSCLGRQKINYSSTKRELDGEDCIIFDFNYL